MPIDYLYNLTKNCDYAPLRMLTAVCFIFATCIIIPGTNNAKKEANILIACIQNALSSFVVR